MILPNQVVECGAEESGWDFISTPQIRKPRQRIYITKRWGIVLVVVFVLLTLIAFAWSCWYIRNEIRLEAEREYAAARDSQRLARLLPKGYTLDMEFADSPIGKGPRQERAVTTMGKKLEKLGAYCKDGKIHDREGRKVIFFGVPEWGMVPSNKQEVWRAEEIEKHEKLEAEGACVVWMWATQIPQ